MHLLIGSFLQEGKYRIIRFISSGGFGCTYEAEHILFKKRVAIKEFFVKDFCGRDERTAYVTIQTTNKRDLVEKLKQKFIDEARSIFDLHHLGIVRVTDVFEENDTAYYVMDYIEGRSLKDIVETEGALPESRALEYIRQVANALGYIHAHNRLHLDIKPGNIMIDSNDRAILIDFGVSKQYDEVNGENTSTLLGQTPGYAPPEQMGNDLVKFTPATDIYALGATFYKLLSGITPISGNLRYSGEKLEPLSAAISASTRKVIERAMTINRYERIQSVSEFQEGLNIRIFSNKLDNLNLKSIVKKLLWVIIVLIVIVLGYKLFYREGVMVSESLISIIDKPIKIEKTEVTKGDINGHEYVDLGLSVKWATMNVGAESVCDYGDYFAWGEINPKSEYTYLNSITYDKDMDNISGYSKYDAARYHWGGSWRLPTESEFEELKNKCRWIWSNQNGCIGYRVIGPNANSIFLPAAGYHYETTVDDVGICGYFWSGTPDGNYGAYILLFDEGRHGVDGEGRDFGHSLRPVSD